MDDIHRRKFLQVSGITLLTGLTGYTGDTQDSDVDGVIASDDYAPQNPDMQDKSDGGNSIKQKESDSPTEEQLIEHSSDRDLLPDASSIATGDNWSATDLDTDPAGDYDVSIKYTVGGDRTPTGDVAVSAYNNIPDSEQRYGDFLDSVENQSDYNIRDRDSYIGVANEAFRVVRPERTVQVTRFKNVVFAVASPCCTAGDVGAIVDAVIDHLTQKISSPAEPSGSSSAASTQTTRGFFTNDPSSSSRFINDVSITIIGIVLSALGIFINLTGSR